MYSFFTYNRHNFKLGSFCLVNIIHLILVISISVLLAGCCLVLYMVKLYSLGVVTLLNQPSSSVHMFIMRDHERKCRDLNLNYNYIYKNKNVI